MNSRGPWPKPTCSWVVLGVLVLTLTSAPAAEAIFAKHCASCHGQDGRARTPLARKLGVKDLTKSQASDEAMREQIRQGKKDERGRPKMPPFGDKLSAEEVESLITFVNGLRKQPAP